MKKIPLLIALVFSLLGTAQEHHKKSELSKEQQAILQTKKLELMLDLSKEQSKQIEQEFKNNRSQFSKAKQKREKLNAEERYALRVEQLNRQIAMQTKMKNILNEKQYTEWKKIKSTQNQKGRKRGGPMKPHIKKGGS